MGADLPEGSVAGSRPVKAGGPLIATRRARLRYAFTSRLAMSAVLFLVLTIIAGGAWSHRDDIAARLRGPDPSPTAAASPVPSPSPSRSELSAEQIQAIIDARAELADSIAAAEKALSGAQDEDTSALKLALSAAKKAVVKADPDRMDETRAILDNAVSTLTAPDPEPQPQETAPAADPAPVQPAPDVSTPEPEPAQPAPAPAPVPAAPSRATVSKTVSCPAKGNVVFTASGGGTVNLNAGGQSTSGAGSASLTITVSGGSVTATATADSQVAINWSASSGGCS